MLMSFHAQSADQVKVHDSANPSLSHLSGMSPNLDIDFFHLTCWQCLYIYIYTVYALFQFVLMHKLNLSLEDTSTLTVMHDNVLLGENAHKWGLRIPLPQGLLIDLLQLPACVYHSLTLREPLKAITGIFRLKSASSIFLCHAWITGNFYKISINLPLN